MGFILDEESNSIGAMPMHLAATERFYQLHSLEGRKWEDFDKKHTNMRQIGNQLDEKARNEIMGSPLSSYTDKLDALREKTKAEIKKTG